MKNLNWYKCILEKDDTLNSKKYACTYDNEQLRISYKIHEKIYHHLSMSILNLDKLEILRLPTSAELLSALLFITEGTEPNYDIELVENKLGYHIWWKN